MGLFKRLKGHGGLIKSNTPPTNKNASWLDTSGTQPVVKFFNDTTSSWEVVDDNNADFIRGKNVPIPTSTESGKILSYDFATDSMVWIEDKSGVSINDTSTTSTTEVWSANKINTELSGKASSTHTHEISAVTNLQTELDGKQKDITKSSVAPASPVANDLWLDTSVDPHLLKKYDGTALAWKNVGSNGNATKIQGKSVSTPTTTENGKILKYDDVTSSFVYEPLPVDTKDAVTIQGVPVDAFAPTATEDGHVLTWDNTLGKFILKPKPVSGGYSALSTYGQSVGSSFSTTFVSTTISSI